MVNVKFGLFLGHPLSQGVLSIACKSGEIEGVKRFLICTESRRFFPLLLRVFWLFPLLAF